ncbi:MAG: para-nitrobenzyl esterase [Candidatus Azotimanducaceae bacterium]|jgi:para-nitrobenzyl esterase
MERTVSDSEEHIGIAYATAERFEQPVDIAYNGSSTQSPVRAPQVAGALDQMLGGNPPPMDEDCLQLNVFTPARDNGSRPVLVWIHGGAFTNGTAHMPWYDGTALVERGNVVVVSINYRLGALGYLGDTNCGTLDKVSALRWVQRHIADFGGNPDNVTVFGESAGGAGIIALYATPAADGLFHRAWAMSPSILQLRTSEQAAEYQRTFLDLLGADSLVAAKSASLDDILDAQNRMPLSGAGLKNFSPTEGCSSIPEPILGTAATDLRPLVIGTTRDEMLLFTTFDPSRAGWTDAEVDRQFSQRFGATSDEAVSEYRRLRPDTNASQLISAMQTDEMFRVPAQQLASDRTAPTWMYLFDVPSTAFGGVLGSCHGSDIPYMFDNLAQPGVSKFLGDDSAQNVSEHFSEALIEFARSGEPDWRPYDREQRNTQIFGIDAGVVGDPEATIRLLWH